MICLKTAKKYCKDFTKIENYDEAVTDTTEMWVCHHKLENIFTLQELVDMGIYYNIKPGELMFIRKSEHQGNAKLHIGCRRKNESQKGKVCSEETKRKLSEVTKGKNNPMYGKTHSEETKHKLSMSNRNNPKQNCKAVVCVETGVVYPSIKEAERKTAISNGNISNACRGKLETAGGYHWRYE